MIRIPLLKSLMSHRPGILSYLITALSSFRNKMTLMIRDIIRIYISQVCKLSRLEMSFFHLKYKKETLLETEKRLNLFLFGG